MKKCNRNNKKQSWQCVGNKKQNIMQTKSSRYMYYGQFSDYVTTIRFATAEWTRYDTQKDVCSQGNLKNQCITMNHKQHNLFTF